MWPCVNMGNSYAKESRVNRLKPQDFAIDLDTFFWGEIPTDIAKMRILTCFRILGLQENLPKQQSGLGHERTLFDHFLPPQSRNPFRWTTSQLQTGGIQYKLLGGDWNINLMTFPSYGECHHPNWRSQSFFRGVGILPTRFFSLGNVMMDQLRMVVVSIFGRSHRDTRAGCFDPTTFQQDAAELRSILAGWNWISLKSTGNHGFYHQI